MFHTAEFDVLAASNPHLTYIANISRGDIINQPALITALKENKLRGAALDVTSPEPLPSDDPLWEAPNLVLTPHVSGNSVRYMERAFQVLEENLRRRFAGGRLVNEVDRKKGY
jgi:phosphoglycerate dehydrogenase-like enzyme